jgi:hypothetical protein
LWGSWLGTVSLPNPSPKGYHLFDPEVSFGGFLGAFPQVNLIPDAWVRDDSTTDSVLQGLSHEMVEAISDPNDGLNLPVIGGLIPPGITVSGGQTNGIGFNEIGDAEPDDQYFYRLPPATGTSGTSVQAYWSAVDNAFIVPDGNDEKFFLDPIYASPNLVSPATFTNTYDLSFHADQGLNRPDGFTIDMVNGGVKLTVHNSHTNQDETATFDPGVIHSITLDLGNQANTVNIEHTPVDVTIRENGGTDAVNLSPTARSLGTTIQGTVALMGTATTTVTVEDQNNSSSDTYKLVPGGMHDQSGSGCSIDHAYTLNVYPGRGTSNDIEVQGELVGSATNLYLNASPANTVNVLGNFRGSTLDVYSLSAGTAANIDTINLGAANPGIFNPGQPGNLDLIGSGGTVHGRANGTDVNLLDQSVMTTFTYTVTSKAVTRPASANPAQTAGVTLVGGVRNLALRASSANDTFVLQSLPTGLLSMSVTGGGAQNSVQSQLPGYHTWAISPGGSNVTLDSGPGQITFSNVWNLTGGPGVDRFQFIRKTTSEGTLQDGSIGGFLDGGLYSAGDWLDYFQNANPVNVNLATGTATGVGGGVRNLQHVHGSSTAANTLVGNKMGNILIGGAAADVLIAGSGNSILIGGGGADTLANNSSLANGSAQTGFNIMIGGRTDFDTLTPANVRVLNAFFGAWQAVNSVATYHAEVTLLRDTGLVVGATRYWLNSSSVHAVPGPAPYFKNTAQTTLDWFFWPTGSVFLNPPAVGEVGTQIF